jgi:hypothetical protein
MSGLKASGSGSKKRVAEENAALAADATAKAARAAADEGRELVEQNTTNLEAAEQLQTKLEDKEAAADAAAVAPTTTGQTAERAAAPPATDELLVRTRRYNFSACFCVVSKLVCNLYFVPIFFWPIRPPFFPGAFPRAA